MESPIYKEIEDVIFNPKGVGKEEKRPSGILAVFAFFLGLFIYWSFFLALFGTILAKKSIIEDSSEYLIIPIWILVAIVITHLGAVQNVRSEGRKPTLNYILIAHVIVLVIAIILGVISALLTQESFQNIY